jgi:hypothetical protein
MGLVPGGGVGEQVLVRREEALPVEQVHVVLVVEGIGRPDVVHRPEMQTGSCFCPRKQGL